MRTLIIDDSVVIRRFIERLLRQAGLDISELHQAGNGIEALEILRTISSFDLIFSDINMPGMDGMEFLKQRHLQHLAPAVPIIMITAEASETLLARIQSAGASGCLSKPFTSEQVKACLGPLLSGHAQSSRGCQ